MNKLGFVITSKGWGGLEINVLRLIQWLTERNWEITLYTINDSRLYQEVIQNTAIRTIEINNHRKYFDFVEAYKFSKLLKSHGIKQIIVSDNRDLDFIFFTKIFLSNHLKVIYQQHMQVGVNKKDLLHTMRFSAINYWISPLNMLKEEVLDKTNVKPIKIKIIPFCLEIDKLVNRKYTKDEARQKLGISPSSLLLGIIGRVDPLKGQLFLIKTLKELQKDYANLELLVIGEPTVNEIESQKYYEEITDYIETHKLTDKIHLRGFIKDVNLFFNAIDIFALASEGETFGMVTIEAMLSRVPIIATHSTGTPEILNYGDLGYLYTPNDVSDFCNKFADMIQKIDKLDEMAGKAQRSAMERFSHTYECDKIEEILKA
jgi:glycosyltransferase involved in cell wall biosynthesis